MDILPAIDLLEGRCVRLIQGRYDRVITYERDPVEVARGFQQDGACWVHVIDLDGARAGRLANLHALQRIAATGLNVQFGGGIRDEQTIRDALAAGARRVIIGTRALEDPDWFREVVHSDEFRGHIALGLDARMGKLAVRGWTEQTTQTAVELAERVADWPLDAIVYTDIGRDGMLLGPNVEAIRSLAGVSRVPVIASGGVTELEDIRRLKDAGVVGVVIGRAIYEQMIELREALRLARGASGTA